MQHEPSSTHDSTGNRWEDRARHIAELREEYGPEIDAEKLYQVRRFSEVSGLEPRVFHRWPDNASILRDARAAYGERLGDEAGYVRGQRERQARGAEYFAPLGSPEMVVDASPVRLASPVPLRGWANVKACMRYWPTAILFTLGIIYVIGFTAVIFYEVMK